MKFQETSSSQVVVLNEILRKEEKTWKTHTVELSPAGCLAINFIIYSLLQILCFFFHAPGHNARRLTNCSSGCVRFWLRNTSRVWRRSLCNHLQENIFSNHTSSAHTATAVAEARIIRLTPPQTEYTLSCSWTGSCRPATRGIIGSGCKAGANRLRVRTGFSVDYIPASSLPLSGPTPAEWLTVITRAFEVLAEACKAKLSAQLSAWPRCLQRVRRWQSGEVSALEELTQKWTSVPTAFWQCSLRGQQGESEWVSDFH